MDNTQILSYGADAQSKSADFADSVLRSSRSKDFNEIGNMLVNLVTEIKSFDANSNKGFLSRLFSPAKTKIERLKNSYSAAEANIDSIVDGLKRHRFVLMKDISMMDSMYKQTVEYIKEISNYIEAGEEKIKEIKENKLPAMHEKAADGTDQMTVQEFKDMTDALNRFEKKIHDLKLTRTVSLQLLPQIRLQQANNSILVDKIHSSIVNSIPLWKSQMVIALGLVHTHSALNAQKAVTDATNEMLKKNSEMLKTATIETAKESERSIVSIETIKKANDDIVYAIQQVTSIQKDAKQKREEAEKELLRLGNELRENVMKELTSK